MTSTDVDVMEIRHVVATKGNWAIGANHDRILDDHGNTLLVYKGQEVQALADLRFIAFAKQDVPKLIAEVRRLKEELEVALAQIRELSTRPT